ncbi:MAG: RNA polymerase sigma factor [Polyangiaceae bacterium]
MIRSVPQLVPGALADYDLVARCVAGDRAAQRYLFDREKRRVYATLFRILGPNQQLDDLLQEVFLSVFRSIGTFRGESSLSTWIDRCAVRAALGHMRSRRPRPLELVAEQVPSDDPGAERRALAREAVRRLYTVLEGLDPAQRLAFTLHAVDGRRLPEVAELTGASLVATKARVWRARRYVEKRASVDPVLSDYWRAAVRRSASVDGAGYP